MYSSGHCYHVWHLLRLQFTMNCRQGMLMKPTRCAGEMKHYASAARCRAHNGPLRYEGSADERMGRKRHHKCKSRSDIRWSTHLLYHTTLEIGGSPLHF